MSSNELNSHVPKYILDKITESYCYCKIILNDLGEPVDFLIKDVNKAFETISGVDSDKILGNKASKVFNNIKNADFDLIDLCGQIALSGGEKTIEQYSMITRSWYKVIVFSPKKYYVVLLFSEIKKGIDNINEKENILTVSHDIIFNLDSNYVIQNVISSQETNKRLRIDKDHFVGKRINDVVSGNILDNFLRAFKVAYSSGENQILEYECDHFEEPLWLRAEVAFVVRENKSHYIVMVTDITDSKKVDEKLISKEEQVQNPFPVNIDLFCIIDRNICFKKINEKWVHTFGYNVEEIQGKPLIDFIHPNDIEPFTEFIAKLKLSCEPEKVVARFRNEDGTYKYLEWYMEFIGEDIYASARDISQEKREAQIYYLNHLRSQALLQLGRMTGSPIKEITDFALEKAVELTHSKVGYLAFLNEDETVLKMYSWSKSAMKQCNTLDKPLDYPINTTGLWGEAVRQRKPIITNDYQASNSLKKGVPEGHVQLSRHMNVPIFDGDKIVLLIGVGNKEEEYTQDEVNGLILLMEGLWRILRRKSSEEALKESEHKYRELVENANSIILKFDSNGNILYLNEFGQSFFGYSSSEILGKSVMGTIVPEKDFQNKDLREMILDISKRPEYYIHNENENIKKDGSRVWISWTNKPVYDKDGNLIHILAIGKDMTDQKRAENEITEWKSLFEYIIKHDPNAIAILDKNLNFKFVSDRFKRDYKVYDTDIIGKHHYDVFPDIPEKWRKIHQRALNGEILSQKEDSFQRTDGSFDWTRWECRPWYGQYGDIGGIVIYTEVITQRKIAEQKIIEKNQLLEAIIDSTPDILTIQFPDHTIEWSNRFGHEVLNLNPEEVSGKKCYEVFGLTDNCDTCVSEVALMMRRKESLEKYIPELGKYFEFHSSPILDDNGNVIRIVEHIRDVTENKRLQELERNRLIVQEIHHRVKNNLQVIISLLNMQSRLFKDKELKEVFKDSQNRIRSMSLAHEKLYGTDNIANIEVSDYLKSLINHISKSYQSNERTVMINFSSDTAHLDMEKIIPIGLILNEILTNSFKHAFPAQEKEDNQISVSFKKNNEVYQLLVYDNGIGLPADFDMEKSDSLGFKIIKMLAQQLEGNLEYGNSDGTFIKVIF